MESRRWGMRTMENIEAVFRMVSEDASFEKSGRAL
jgi:hypothetical protein